MNNIHWKYESNVVSTQVDKSKIDKEIEEWNDHYSLVLDHEISWGIDHLNGCADVFIVSEDHAEVKHSSNKH